ncbi:tetratricopeptide repeat-containing sensor histidine kinase [Ferruginibacter profundus]
MKQPVYKWIILLLCFATHNLQAQTRVIDSLKQLYKNATDGDNKLSALFNLCEQHQSIQKDTLYLYAVEAGKLANDTHDKINKGRAAVILINAYLRKGKTDSAEAIVNANLPLYDVKDAETRSLFFLLSALQVDCFGEKTNYEDAVAALYKIINLAEQYKDFPVLAKNMSTLGVINYNLNHVPEAFSWYFKGLAVCQDAPAFYAPASVLYINLAETYRWVEKTDSAIYCINKAIPLCEKAGNLFYLANALRVKAGIYKARKNYEQAEKTMLECIAIRQKTEGILPLSNEQVALASIYMNWGKTEKAIHELTTALALSDSATTTSKSASGSEADVLKISYYTTLARCYKLKGDDKNYTITLEKMIAAKDAFYEANSANALAELQAKYELQKKESTIIKQKLDITQQNYLFYGSLIFAAFTLLVLWLLFRNYRRKQHIKMQFALQEEKRIAAQSIIDAEENERKRIAADLHDNIGAYASAIRADVEKITDNGFEKNNAALQNLQQHSQEIINSLRDTIWVLNKEHITITGISDRIKNYISKLQPTYDMVQFHINEFITNDVRISSQHALNIFRITQEAIHNALKHSNAANINIDIRSTDNIAIHIADDGAGIKNQDKAEGNGLLNMKARAKEIGMEVFVAAPSTGGTTVTLKTATTN